EVPGVRSAARLPASADDARDHGRGRHRPRRADPPRGRLAQPRRARRLPLRGRVPRPDRARPGRGVRGRVPRPQALVPRALRRGVLRRADPPGKRGTRHRPPLPVLRRGGRGGVPSALAL
ncbi:MAG: hypothetical protein AVDCRST_MAG31-1069, partial [uncultured Sphingomonas sp.]